MLWGRFPMAGDLPGAHWDEIQNDVFLLHFGGPTSSAEVEPFLIELFEDPFILRILLPEFLRKMLGRFIARRRVPKSDSQYRAIGYSPINRYTEIQARLLEKNYGKSAPRREFTLSTATRHRVPVKSFVILIRGNSGGCFC